MEYEIIENKIIISNPTTFDIKAVLECGQVFRYKKTDGGYQVVAGDKKAVLKEENGKIIIEQNDAKFFEKYFDLCRNYDIIISKLGCKGLIGAACGFGKGIRILNQNPVETIFSFIISANNHIPRIKSIIERICAELGEDCHEYYAFPTISALASKGEDFYFKLGAGYRANYISETAKTLESGFDIDGIYEMPTPEARKKLCALKGVGPKVADCILLFGYHKTDVFPVDTWIKKVYADCYGETASAAEMSKRLTAEYGDLAGYAQQYLFYYKREQKIK